MLGARTERLELLFHTRVLGRPEKEAIIPSYCTSLDAAWEGVQDKFFVEICGPFLGRPVERRFQCWVDRRLKENTTADTYADESHPAEALVLACLRAVGTPEEELG